MNKHPAEGQGRILCVTSNLPRWAGDSTTPFVLNLAEDLQELGWEVDLLAPHAPDSAVTESLAGVRVERFRYLWPDRLQTVCYQGGALINLRKQKANYFKLPALLGAEFAAVAWRLARNRYDIVHSHWILPQGFIGMLATKVHRVPHVVTVHGGDVFGLRGAAMGWAKSVTLRSADAVTVNSRYTGGAVDALMPGLGNVHRIPMGVATRELGEELVSCAQDLREKHLYGAGPLLVFVGRIVDEKGVEDLLRAVSQLSADLPDVRALIVGEGQDRPEMEALAISLGISEKVVFTGWVDPELVRSYFAAADVVVAPSRRATDGWIEAQGLTVLEAMIARVPVLATRLGGVTDSVIHEKTGLLVDERSPEQIASSIRRLITNPVLVETLVDNAYVHAFENYSRLSSARAFSELFQRLMKGGT